VEDVDGARNGASSDRPGAVFVEGFVLFGLMPLREATNMHSAPFLLQREH
jgi:hypothetical protein